MADNNFFFKVLAELSDTEYFPFFSHWGEGGSGLQWKIPLFFFKTLPNPVFKTVYTNYPMIQPVYTCCMIETVIHITLVLNLCVRITL